jgi:hypothetical protein
MTLAFRPAKKICAAAPLFRRSIGFRQHSRPPDFAPEVDQCGDELLKGRGPFLGLPNHRRCGIVAGMYTSQKKIEQASTLPRSFSEVTARDIVGMIVGALLGYLLLVYW